VGTARLITLRRQAAMIDRTAVHYYAAIQAKATGIFAASVTLSVAAHFALFAWNPAFDTEDMGYDSTELTAIDIPPTVDIPPPPQSIARPAVPVVSSRDIDDDITIAPTTFEANPLSNLPPPPVATRDEQDIRSAPQFTPYTVRPELRNPDLIRAQLVRYYPPLLRDAGVGGTVIVWVLITEQGVVERSVVKESSGHQGLDDAALRVAPEMQFTPAIFRDRRVPVWIEIPLHFTTR
jgi:TonB family protein